MHKDTLAGLNAIFVAMNMASVCLNMANQHFALAASNFAAGWLVEAQLLWWEQRA